MQKQATRVPVRRLAMVIAGVALALTATACKDDSGSQGESQTEGAAAVTESQAGGQEPQESPDAASGDFVVLPGTGSYAIGTEAPFGGYQLHGEPDEQPAGCTWQILDADGNVSFENTGQYVWLTDIHEAVTFVTTGCPDWEQFE